MRLASGAAGVHHRTAGRWYHEQDAFRAAVDAARARRATRWLRIIEDAAGEDWQAARWLLEHCETEDYGKSVKTSVQEEIASFLNGLKGRLGSQAWREVLVAASEQGAGVAGGASAGSGQH